MKPVLSKTARRRRALPKDGYTLAMASNNHVINPSVYKSMPFDSIKDITTISVIGSTPVAILAHPSLAARNAQELIALAKAKPGELNYGSGGNGSVVHLAGVLFVSEAGVTIVGSTPDAAARFFRIELDKHTSLVKRSGAVVE